VLARLSGAGEDTILGDPADRLFEGSPPADVVILGLAGDFEVELEFAHRFARRLGQARWLLVVEGKDQADARRLFDTLDAELVVFPPSADELRRRLRSALTRRSVDHLSERRARDAVAARFARWFARLDLPEVLRALDPRLARTPVLIRGEHGTGRTLLALYLHAFGGTTGGALVQVSCQPSLAACDLLALIGAAAHSERSHRSLTVVLEDVDRLAPAVQRDLRGWIELAAPPVVAHSAWVRWIGTVSETPAEPEPVIDIGLRQALAAIPISLPPLRESRERVVALAEDAALAFCEATGSRPRRFALDALEALSQHPWPGNLRELEAVVARTLAATASEIIHADGLHFDTEPLIAAAATAQAPEETEPETRPLAPPADSLEADAGDAGESPELETWRLLEEAAGGPESWTHAPEASATEPEAPEPSPAEPPPQMGLPAPEELAFGTAPAQLVGDRALRRFLASISHELGNSVMPLRTAAALLSERFNDPELRARFGEIVQTDSRRTEEVLARLLRFASFGPPARSALDLSELLDTLVDEQRPDLEIRQVLLLRELERDQPRVLGDPAQIRFGLEALLRKALQLVKVRGDLYLASRFHPHGLRGAPSIRVLLRFQTAAPILPTGSVEGVALSETALDLLLTEAIARAHGGRFTLDAGESKETVVLIDLPAPAAGPQGSGKIAVS
jgi:hypothetical protein